MATSTRISITANNSRFEWHRDPHGNGGWITTHHYRGLPPRTLVHAELNANLTEKAKEEGIEEVYGFGEKPAPVKPGGTGTRKRREKKPDPFTFNPFAM